MTGFLNILAGMALGVQPAGAAQVSLPSRFAPASSAWESEPPRLGEPVEQAEPRAAPLQSDRSGERNAPESERVLPKGVTAPMDRQDGPRRQPATNAVSNVRDPPPMAPLPQNARQLARAALPDDAAAQPTDSKPLAEINRAEPKPPSNRQPVSAQALLVVQPGPRFRAEPPQAPLSDAALAGRSITARERPSIVQVTIDRIDVRAPPSPATPKPQRRAQPQPAVSLSDYLRDGAKAGRP
jgi:hypothetical protein